MMAFIERSGYRDKIVVINSILNQALIDYFADIDRLKNFHRIDHVNFIKIHAYSAYWILRRKPLQVIKDDDEDMELAFVNENFVASYLMRFLRGDNHGVVIKEEDRSEYNEFVNNLNVNFQPPVPKVEHWDIKTHAHYGFVDINIIYLNRYVRT